LVLAEQRGMRNRLAPPRLRGRQILAWASAHYRRTGRWPTLHSGPIPEAPGETWNAVDAALKAGTRGLRGGSSLARILSRHRGVRTRVDLPPLSYKQILAWADAHHARTGTWPNVGSGPVQDAPGENWRTLNHALQVGVRGLTGGSSLHQLLVRKRGLPRRFGRVLSEGEILRWAELHRRRSGAWPTSHSGPVADAPGETWAGVDGALRKGARGLVGATSLSRLLAAHGSEVQDQSERRRGEERRREDAAAGQANAINSD
jgi:hypothetical protein